MSDLDELRRLAPPRPSVGQPLPTERDAALARILASPRRSRRRRLVQRAAIGSVAALGATAALVVWVHGRGADGVRITLDGAGTSAVAPTGGPVVEVDVEVSPAPGVSLSDDALLDRAEKVLKARGAALSIDGFAVRRGQGSHLIVKVPRAEDSGPEANPAFVYSPGFAVYSGSQIIRSGVSNLDVVEQLARIKGQTPGSWFVIQDFRGGRRFTPYLAAGPFASAAAASTAFAGSGPTTPLGKPLTRNRVVRIPAGVAVLAVGGLPPDGNHRGERNGWYAVRGAPVLSGEDVAEVGKPASRSLTLTPDGAARLAEALKQAPAGLRAGRPAFFAAVGGSGSEVDRGRSLDGLLVLKQPYAKWRRRVHPQESIFTASLFGSSVSPLDGGAAAIQMYPVATRQVGRLPNRSGTALRAIPGPIARAIQAESTLNGVRQPACCTVRSLPATVREMVRVPLNSDADVRLLTAMRTDGTERPFVLARRISRIVIGGPECRLSADSPAVQGCAFYERGSGNSSKGLIMIGRTARDVASVWGIRRRTGDASVGVVSNGWFVLLTPRGVAIDEVVAQNSRGEVIGRHRQTWQDGG